MMATASLQPDVKQSPGLQLRAIARFPRMRALFWSGNVLYASRGYTLLRARISGDEIDWEQVAQFNAPLWRKLTSRLPLSARLCRDGFHALTVLPSGDLVGAVPGAIVTLQHGQHDFRVSHRIVQGTRPLHICSTPDGRCFWGEYFDNPHRDQVHIYASSDGGCTWDIAYTFAHGAIRHIHNIVYDRLDDCLWILTGDNRAECRILRASCDLRTVEVVLAGTQQARAVALVPTRDALYFASDTPFETNYVYRMDRAGNITRLAALSSSSIYGCSVGNSLFFSTMVEPSTVNRDPHVRIFGSTDGERWQPLLSWQKDRLPAGLFQYGNALFADGENTSNYLAISTVAVSGADLETSLWQVTN